ncbi:hypothetical protein PHET_02459 [Paragonimus heterotremus]|uniref:Calponin-homology (CH) domain-containing protein n=1 Tax=Paragonimus heterotremus TaxID=100268 RepID=A0A8J4T216_9TREM|nr:hypothetical protein PHET_02459 [Paragonimus heterotremus]
MVSESEKTGEIRHAKDALLLWCQLKTAGYPQVEIADFTSSWRDGLAFCALLHRHYPELIDFDNLTKMHSEPLERFEIAFSQAADHLGIPKLIEPMDLISGWWADEWCILTIVVTWYRWLNDSQYTQRSANRLNHVLNQCILLHRLATRYLIRIHRWLQWACVSTDRLNETRRHLSEYGQTEQTNGDSETCIRMELQKLTKWRQVDVTEKMTERSQLEFTLHKVQASQLAASHFLFVPPEGYGITDVYRTWDELMSAEHECHLTIMNELTRQANQKHFIQRFDRKLCSYAHWLEENEHILLVAEQTDAVTFRTDMEPIVSFISRKHNLWTAVYQLPEFVQFPVWLNKITTVQRKHAAWIADTEAYSQIRLKRLNSLAAELENRPWSMETCDRLRQWRVLSRRWEQLEAHMRLRARALEHVEHWYHLLAELRDMFGQLSTHLTELQQTVQSEQVSSVEMILAKCKQDLESLSYWQSVLKLSLKSVLDETVSQPNWIVLLDLRNLNSQCDEWVAGICSCLNKDVEKLQQWNSQKLRALQILDDIKNELSWIQVS